MVLVARVPRADWYEAFRSAVLVVGASALIAALAAAGLDRKRFTDAAIASITFVVAASGLTFLGIGAAFWALAAGLLVRAVLARGGRPHADATLAGQPAAVGAGPAESPVAEAAE